MLEKPKIIALCGRPGSGKTTLAKILKCNLGYEIIDDAMPMRDIAMRHFGLTPEDVFTQHGKRKNIEFMNEDWTVREILGQIGNALEDKFGPDVIPTMAFMQMNKEQNAHKNFVLPSVRRKQGLFWESKGALVVEVYNPYIIDRRPFAFDQYDKSAIELQVTNNFNPAEPGLNIKECLDQFYANFRWHARQCGYNLDV